MRFSTKELTVSAVFAAVICVLSPITLFPATIPISLGLFGVLLCAVILGAMRSAVSVLIFVLIGAVGLPVFSGFKGGFSVLAGPTGGYIWSYVFVSLIVGAFSSKFPQKKLSDALFIFLGCLLGVLVCYFLGTLQFMQVSGNDINKSLALCVFPFIPVDIIKSVIAVFIGISVRERIGKIYNK